MIALRTIVVMLMLSVTPSLAAEQQLHHHEGASGVVDQFYSYWLRPNAGKPRTASCCNKLDCYATKAYKVGSHWFFIHRETQKPRIVPDEVVEHLQSDPRESPDGESHVCANVIGTVYCFVAGSMT